MEKTTKSKEQDPSRKSARERRLSKRSSKAAPGPGDSLESDRIAYHEEPSPKAGSKSYEHRSEKNLED